VQERMFVLLDFGYEGAKSKKWCHSYLKLALNAMQIKLNLGKHFFFSRKPYNKTAEYISLCYVCYHVDSSETRDDELFFATQVQIVISSGRNDFERISRHGGMYTTFWG
jgi:hypothetical protein